MSTSHDQPIIAQHCVPPSSPKYYMRPYAQVALKNIRKKIVFYSQFSFSPILLHLVKYSFLNCLFNLNLAWLFLPDIYVRLYVL